MPERAQPEPSEVKLPLKISVAPIAIADATLEPAAAEAAAREAEKLEERGFVQSPYRMRPVPVATGDVREELIAALGTQGLFARAEGFDMPGGPDGEEGLWGSEKAAGDVHGQAEYEGAEVQALLEAARARGDDLLLRLSVRRHSIRYIGANQYLPWKVIVWVNVWIPAWWIADQDFRADFEVEAELIRAETGESLYTRVHTAEVIASLDDFDYGFHALSLFRVPGSLNDERWALVAQKLLGPARSRAMVAILADLARTCPPLVAFVPAERLDTGSAGNPPAEPPGMGPDAPPPAPATSRSEDGAGAAPRDDALDRALGRDP